MGMSYEFERNIKAAQEAADIKAVKALQAQQALLQSLVDAGIVKELSLEVRPLEAPQVVTPQSRGKTEEQASQNLLRQAIAEYKRGVRTPEMWTAYWQAKFQVDGAKIGLNVEVPDCDWTEEEIRRPMVDIEGKEVPGFMVPLIPGITLPILGRMYPTMQSYTVREDSPVIDTHDTGRWIKVYASVDAPNRNSKWSDAKKFADEQRYHLGREITYILGSQASKDLQGEYFDQGSTWSWLPGSRDGGRLVYARFGSGGHLDAHWVLDPEIPRQDEGWRFEEVRPKA